MDANGVAQPSLAVRWASENGDHRWEFWLRPGVHFQDGTALTAAAIEASLTGSCGTGCPWTAVHAVGTEVIFTSDAPMPNLPALLAGDDFLIARSGTINSSGVSPGATSLTGLVIGTGPFEPDQYDEWSSQPGGERLLLAGPSLSGQDRNPRTQVDTGPVARPERGARRRG